MDAKKQILWDKTMAQLARVADKLGKPIDEGIKETVVAFIVNNFPTCGSCAGHIEKRFGKMIKLAPYVEIEQEEPRQRFVGEAQIKEKIATEMGVSPEEIEENEQARQVYWDYIQENDTPETPEYIANRAQNKEMEKIVFDLLHEFDKNRQSSKEKLLIIQEIGPSGRFRITTSAVSPIEVETSEMENQKQKLKKEQEEIVAFGLFLKRHFINTK